MESVILTVESELVLRPIWPSEYIRNAIILALSLNFKKLCCFYLCWSWNSVAIRLTQGELLEFERLHKERSQTSQLSLLTIIKQPFWSTANNSCTKANPTNISHAWSNQKKSQTKPTPDYWPVESFAAWMAAVSKPLSSWIYYIAKVIEYKFYIVHFPTFNFNLFITLRQDKCIFMVYYIFIFVLNLNVEVENFGNIF